MKISFKIAASFIVVVLVLVSFFFFNNSPEKVNEEENTNINYGKLDEIIFNVKTKKVFKGDLIKSIQANGIIKAFKELEVVSSISGFINQIYIYEGKKVKKGDLLLKFDDREQKIAVSEAEVNLMNAKIEYGFLARDPVQTIDKTVVDSIQRKITKLEDDFRLKKINEEDYLKKKEQFDLDLIFSGAKRDEVFLNKSGMTSAFNQLNKAKLNLSYTEVIAPFDGFVSDFNLVPNMRINAGEKLFKLLDASKFIVKIGVIESEIAKIKVGNKASITLNAIPGKTFNGEVVYINPLVDTQTKTCRVTIVISNSNTEIKSGMFATATIQSEALKNRLLIPKEALLVRDKRNLVFVADGNLAKWHYVDIGEQNDNYIEILNGVEEGDDVIVEGHYNLAHDSNIEVINN